LDVAANAIKLRKHLAQIDPTAAFIFDPDALWHPAAKGSIEYDGSTKNSNTSFRLLTLRDRDIIRKMRLYCQAFTGYQLATLEMVGKRPWLSRKLPDNWDETLKILAAPPPAALINYALIDLPESFAFASIYCSTLFPDMEHGVIENTESFALPREPGFTFIPNMLYHNLCVDDRLVDLCINTGSMAEMSTTQVNDYCESIGRFMGDTGIFFEQNHSHLQLAEHSLGQEKVTTCLKDITIRHFKNLRKCTTTFVPTYPSKRGTANFWVNLESLDQSSR
jgi:hypothetical protein